MDAAQGVFEIRHCLEIMAVDSPSHRRGVLQLAANFVSAAS
jgi:hypothetical protein